MQDVAQLARLLLTVLVDDGLRQRLSIAARATALQFAPSIIADRHVSLTPIVALGKNHNHDTMWIVALESDCICMINVGACQWL